MSIKHKHSMFNSPLGTNMQRQNLRPIYPGDTVHRRAEDEHEEEEEGHGGGGGWFFDGCS